MSGVGAQTDMLEAAHVVAGAAMMHLERRGRFLVACMGLGVAMAVILWLLGFVPR
jgi:hypothetical protein